MFNERKGNHEHHYFFESEASVERDFSSIETSMAWVLVESFNTDTTELKERIVMLDYTYC